MNTKIMLDRKEYEKQLKRLINELGKMTNNELEIFMRKISFELGYETSYNKIERESLAASALSEAYTGDGYLTIDNITYGIKEVKRIRKQKKYTLKELKNELKKMTDGEIKKFMKMVGLRMLKNKIDKNYLATIIFSELKRLPRIMAMDIIVDAVKYVKNNRGRK